ncbi:MAG: SGNH/GDSL hydrolase family protein [Mycoplasmatales bacterium]
MEKKNLLFMGDSITAGVYGDGIMDYTRNGYDDYIKEAYQRQNKLGTFYNIAVSGFTTKDMLEMLQSDLTYNENVAYNITPESTYKKGNYKQKNTAKLLKKDYKINTLIKEANIIIMTLGSNDFIKYITTHSERFKENFKVKEIVSKNNELSIRTSFLQSILNNYFDIFKYLYHINKNVDIVLIGSYTPNKSEIMNKILFKSLGIVEEELFSTIQEKYPKIKLLPIRKDIKKYKDICLTNPLNIHLNEKGYKIIAQKYINELMP